MGGLMEDCRVFVCICNGLRERDVREAAQGARSVKEAYGRLGASIQCGQCSCHAREILNDARKTQSPDTAVLDAVA
jgi:bacterioferritin-associated ferredoxin